MAISKIFLAALVMAIVIGFSNIPIQGCEDGTEYYKCSVKNPGMKCIGGTQYSPSYLVLDNSQNGCCAQAGGRIVDNECVITCSDGTKHGQCSTSSQFGAPYYCNKGTLEKNTALCACPDNYDIVGNECVLKKGCIYNNPACGIGKICNQLINKCVDICSSTEVYNTATGECDSKNPPADTSTTKPEEKPADDNTDNTDTTSQADLDSILGSVGTVSNKSSGSEKSSATNPNCCMSMALIGTVMLAGYVLRKR